MSGTTNSAPSSRVSIVQSAALVLLRVAIGWHLLYQGIVKLLDSDWTSSAYLVKSNWILKPFFSWITEEPNRMRLADQLNVWGLIVIGLALLCGFLPRLAAFFGAVLLLLYYAMFSPWYGAPARATITLPAKC